MSRPEAEELEPGNECGWVGGNKSTVTGKAQKTEQRGTNKGKTELKERHKPG